MAPSPAHPFLLDTQADADLVEFIDLHTAEPVELERLLEQWRTTALAREHLTSAEIARDDTDRGHLVLEIEYDPKAARGLCELSAATSPEAGLVAALLDRPPRFRGSTPS